MMKIGILTSSRADFGIYYPLVKKMWEDNYLQIEIISFGTHLQESYGYTVKEIESFGFEVLHRIETPVKNHSSKDISNNIGIIIQLFAHFWERNKFDLVFALGDRYEMFAAVSSASTFNIDIAHIHAGETTLGAIDNSYRHSISLMSKYLFVSTEKYKRRAIEITQRPADVFNVGALSIDNLKNQEYFTIQEFENVFKIDLTKPYILSTFHPETIASDKNEKYVEELISVFKVLQNKYQIIITLPNADTKGDIIRSKLGAYAKSNRNIKLIESFGMKGYITVLKHCSMLIGNTSSGFVEAAYFPKWVINIGNRQDGRINTPNVFTTPVVKENILQIVIKIEKAKKIPHNCNIYGNGNTADLILSKINDIYDSKC
jgi:GDP/UDP-N,N'-diacetylbacillosamine 2-epimerase (hydrolysing)